MKKALFTILILFLGLFLIVCGLLFFFQENLIFFPQKLEKDYQFRFKGNFEEVTIPTKDGISLSGLLFKSEAPKGVIFYLHGNAGSLSSWGEEAKTYTDLNYDVFMLDYRGYGKSEGKISSQEQLFKDNQLVYEQLKENYTEENIVILGYSLGSGLASKLAATNNPKLLILQAPYYSIIDIMKHSYSWIPTFILKYKLETNEYLKQCDMPIVLFHGKQDYIIYYGSSLKLKADFPSQITLIPLDNQGHNGMTDNKKYRKEIIQLLAQY